jgi:hypothetical protein
MKIFRGFGVNKSLKMVHSLMLPTQGFVTPPTLPPWSGLIDLPQGEEYSPLKLRGGRGVTSIDFSPELITKGENI